MPFIWPITKFGGRWALVTLAVTAGGLAPMFVHAAAAQESAAPEPWVAPDRASRRVNPVPTSPEVVKKGQELFMRECAKCHGKTGRGDGKEGLTLNPRPGDFTSAKVQSQLDGALFWKMTEGRGVMPQATLGEREKWMVIDYLRTLAGSGGQSPPPGGR
jgi:mono/diheme cytochrome c family protein